MKNLLTLILLFLSTIFFGQSLHILNDKTDITNGSITVPVKKGIKYLTELSLKNTTNDSVYYQVSRSVLNPPMNDTCGDIYFCTGLYCYLPSSDTHWTPNDEGTGIGPNETLPKDTLTYGISAHYDVCKLVCRDLRVKYKVYRLDPNTNDTAYVTINYLCSPASITEQAAALGSLSDAYPNPAYTHFSLHYSMPVFAKSEIAIYNVVGEKVMETALVNKEGTVTINTSQLTPGVYFCGLFINNLAVTTKRLVVTQ